MRASSWPTSRCSRLGEALGGRSGLARRAGRGRSRPARRRGRGGGRVLARPQQVRVAADPHDRAAVLDRQRVGRDGVDQGAVVRDHHHGPVVGLQGRLERLAALGVQVVGGLVEHEQVAAARQQADQAQPAPLTARELLDLAVDHVAREEEPAEQRPRLPRGHVAAREHGLQDGPVLRQVLAVLGEVGERDLVTQAHPAARRRPAPDQGLDEGGLAGPVGPHHGDALAALHGEAGAGHQRPAGHRHVQAVDLDHQPRAALGTREAEGQGGLAARRLDPRQLVEPLLARGRLTRLGAGPPAGHEPLQAGDLGRLALGRDALAIDGQRALAPEGRVAHRPELRAAPVQLEDPGRHGLQEPAVVRDQQHRRAELGQRVLEPLDRHQIEVVGGLVEQEHVRPRDQRPRQRGARQLPA